MDSTATNDKYNTKPFLHLAFEMGNKQWKVGSTIGLGQAPRLRTITAGDLPQLREEIARAKRRFRLSEEVRVVSCYEAGRDGFWLHRYLVSEGIENIIVDSASLEINRRKRKVKTDRVDARKLLTMLLRYHSGEPKVWSVVRVPSLEQEDGRQLHRELSSLKKERTQHINRIKGLLVSQGVRLEIKKDFPKWVSAAKLWDGRPLPPGMKARVLREFARIQLVNQHIKELETERRQTIRTATDPQTEMIRQLLHLRGIGPTSAWLFVKEFFGWRQFRNRREVGALAGLTPTPYQSGDSYREQGIDKAGNRHIRAIAIEIAWGWLRFQPDSALSRWYQDRFGHGNSRMRRIGIVALARKLLIALWRYLETGEVPEGAVLKSAPV
jgi:transposase